MDKLISGIIIYTSLFQAPRVYEKVGENWRGNKSLPISKLTSWGRTKYEILLQWM